MSMILRKHLSPMGFTPENPLISHMNNFSWESRLGRLQGSKSGCPPRHARDALGNSVGGRDPCQPSRSMCESPLTREAYSGRFAIFRDSTGASL